MTESDAGNFWHADNGAFIENSGFGLVLIKKEGRKIVKANRMALEILGRSCDEVLGRRCHQFICPAHEGQCPILDLGQEVDRSEKVVLNGEGETVPILKSVTPIQVDGEDHLLETFADITELISHRDELQEANDRLELARETMMDLSTPVVQIWDEVLALPLIGVLDSQRAQQAMEILLERIIAEKARIIIVDITGVPLVDTLVANYLAQTMAAIRLIGAEGILTGISPLVAQTLVKIGIDISEIETRSTLAEGLKWSLKKLGLKVLKPGGK